MDGVESSTRVHKVVNMRTRDFWQSVDPNLRFRREMQRKTSTWQNINWLHSVRSSPWRLPQSSCINCRSLKHQNHPAAHSELSASFTPHQLCVLQVVSCNALWFFLHSGTHTSNETIHQRGQICFTPSIHFPFLWLLRANVSAAFRMLSLFPVQYFNIMVSTSELRQKVMERCVLWKMAVLSASALKSNEAINDMKDGL